VKARTVASLMVLSLAGPMAGLSPAAPPPLRFGVVSFYNPRLMFLKYQPLMDYLTSATGRPWDLVIVPTYERLVEDVCSGKVTTAYLGPYTYARAHAACKALPVVKLNSGGKATYRCLIMVRSDSKLQSLADLAGKRFGFGAPMSTASHLVARAMLENAGLHPGLDVACRYYAHHEQAARAVLFGEVEACGVRDLVGEKFANRDLKVLARSEEIPNFPLVLAPGSDPALPSELVRVLVSLPGQDARTAAIIRGWDEELSGGFTPATDGEYEPIRKLAVRLFGPSALTLPEPRLECRPGRQ
jgi:phosphonate transport system substrate-binding protein